MILVRIVNKWTFSQTLFNPLRTNRPMNNNLESKTLNEVADTLEEIPEKCDFCSPLSYTGIGSYEASNFLLLLKIVLLVWNKRFLIRKYNKWRIWTLKFLDRGHFLISRETLEMSENYLSKVFLLDAFNKATSVDFHQNNWIILLRVNNI